VCLQPDDDDDDLYDDDSQESEDDVMAENVVNATDNSALGGSGRPSQKSVRYSYTCIHMVDILKGQIATQFTMCNDYRADF